MRSSAFLSAMFAALAAASCSSAPATPSSAPAPAAAAPAATAAASVMAVPADQARRGENAFLSSCTACHSSSEFSDNAFQTRWRNRSAADLFDLMSATMPEDAPNSLPAERYVEIVAYFLTLNGFESAEGAGAWDARALREVSLGALGSY